MKTENIINLFDAAAAPDISVTSPTEVSDQPMSTNSHKALTLPLSCWSRLGFYSLFYSTLYSALPCLLRSTHLATIEPSYSSCCQFDSQAVSSLLDMDLDSFSASTKASTVTQVDDLWHGRRACRETFHYNKCQASQEILCLIQNGFKFNLWYLIPHGESFRMLNIPIAVCI